MTKELLSNLPEVGKVTAISTLKNELKKGETTLELETGLASRFETAESQFRLVIGKEILLVTKVEGSGKKLTVTRNQGENSVEEDHPVAAKVFNFVPREAIELAITEHTANGLIIPQSPPTKATGGSTLLEMCISPNGKWLIANDFAEEKILVFERNLTTGALTKIEAKAAGVKEPYDICISVDGKHIYVSGFGAEAIGVYSLNDTTGVLTKVESKATGKEPVGICVSADGKSVYCSSYAGAKLYQFEGNSTTGALTAYSPAFIETEEHPHHIAISPDNKSVYTANVSGSVGVYERNTSTGLLTKTESKTCSESPQIVICSKDSGYVYTVKTGTGNIAQFSRNTTTGALTVLTPSPAIGKISSLFGLCESPNQKFVYAVSESNPGIVGLWFRDTITGVLHAMNETPTFQVASGNTSLSLKMSPDGKFLYVNNEIGHDISIYTAFIG